MSTLSPIQLVTALQDVEQKLNDLGDSTGDCLPGLLGMEIKTDLLLVQGRIHQIIRKVDQDQLTTSCF